MRAFLFITGILVFGFLSANATTFYISPTGNDSNLGKSTGTPWKTWAYAFSHTSCGDTLMVMDGVYTFAANGQFSLKKVCPITAIYTIHAQNERAAFISGDGSVSPLFIDASAYVNVEGLRVKSADLSTGEKSSAVFVNKSSHITLRRMLVTHNNRYGYTHMIQLTSTSYSLVEENEIYFFSGHGFFTNGYSNHDIFRRNYANPRSHDALSGGPGRGGDAFIAYPGNSITFENNIAENAWAKGFTVQALGFSTGNQFLGNMAMGTNFGMATDARNSDADTTHYWPDSTTIKDLVVLNMRTAGIASHGSKNTRLSHCTVLTGASGIIADRIAVAPGAGVYSFFAENILTAGNTGEGFRVDPVIQTWSADHINSFGNSSNYTPSTSPNHIATGSTDPKLGTCKVWIPDSSPMKHAGKNGEDIGANILYRYQDGILTGQPLWNPSTGEFPHGAIIAGVNDIPGQSLFDVHKRLNVNCNSCPFPASYPKSNPSGVGGRTLDVGRKMLTLRPTGSGLSIHWNGKSHASAKIYSLSGKQIASIQNIGENGVAWNPGKSAAGVYLVKVESGNVAQTAKVFCDR